MRYSLAYAGNRALLFKKYVVQVSENFLSAQIVQAWALLSSSHGKGLPRAGLPVGKAGDFSSKKCTVDQGLDATLIDVLIVTVLVECVVEVEGGLLDVFCEIHFLPASHQKYFNSLTITEPWSGILMISVSLRCSYFLFKGLFLMATVILGDSF